MKTVYFISGLGADKSAFSLLDLSFCHPVFIEWLAPKAKESLQQYALRLKEQITTPSPTIVGLSFGGMLATEIVKAYPTATAVLISSNKTSNEFPAYLRVGKYLPIYKWVPFGFFKKRSFIQNIIFNPKGEVQRKVFKKIILNSDPHFTKWAIGAILQWKNKEVPKNITHIHGTKDRLLPYKFVKDDYAIKNGSHMMILNNADEISALLKKII